ncbi:GCN5-related N-acetyltransferase [Candidatus Filomicrobium marinum]|uniref:GCN5-related N-acetyltransferase n=1 Tax=Candidatus Filomicrobium marinum TaxID=1608628 RepID=A0A0D6JL02_9HYPH|nr:GNAT family N-acetyltransferase [Candidatus Filomicrobium marinum]CFX59506.1 GCN5-related N-acetyltransferase [Candidatus Filomicrobium marinum]CPR22372.1 GCN5-related N-acetyltransferase [Candidatus Filomicrobium marinum]
MDVRSYSAADALKDGTLVIVRAIRHDDRASVLATFKSLDRESVYTRLFTYKKELTEAELKQFTEVDFENVVALVVTIQSGEGGRLIGGGRYYVDAASPAPRSAELAFVTADDWHGRGIASLVLRHLARIARDQGIETFEAEVLAQNRAMLAVFGRSGLKVIQRRDGNTVHVTLLLNE